MSQPNVSNRDSAGQTVFLPSVPERVDEVLARRWCCSPSQAKKRRLRLLEDLADVLRVESAGRQELIIDQASQVMAGVPVTAAENDLRRLELVADTDEDRAEGDFHLNPTLENRERHRRSLSRQGACSLALARSLALPA